MTIVFTLALIIIGVVCLTKAPAIQRRVVRSLDEGRAFNRSRTTSEAEPMYMLAG